MNNNDLEALPGNSDLEALPGGLFKGLSNLESVNLGHNPGAPFTFTAELEQQADGAVMVKVDDGAPYDMAVTLSAEGGTLSSTDVTVAGGSLESGAINVTPNGQRPTQVTVSVESAAFKKKIYSDEGVQAGLGESLTLTFGALVGQTDDPPASVRKPWATNITDRSARIEWQKASRAEEYVVLRRALYADNPESSLSPVHTTSGLSYDDTDLVPQTEYIYRIVARNAAGEAKRSPHLKFRTLPEQVAVRPNSPATGVPTITGTAQVGQTLTASTSGIADTDGLSNPSFSYQWVSNDGTNDTDISGATNSTYTLVEVDEGKTIKVRVSFTDDAGHEEAVSSPATATVAAAVVKPPASVRKPWATNITHNSARIEWKKASRAEEYVVLRRALYADNPESSLSPIATTSGLSYDDTDLVPQTEYIYRIVARNNVGEANRSPHVKFRTLSEP